MMVANKPTSSDSSSLIAISWLTGLPVHIDLPKSSVTSPTIQSPNCAERGLSSPRRVRSAATVSADTAAPSPRSLISTTSPGITRSMKKTSTATPSKVGIASRIRRTA